MLRPSAKSGFDAAVNAPAATSVAAELRPHDFLADAVERDRFAVGRHGDAVFPQQQGPLQRRRGSENHCPLALGDKRVAARMQRLQNPFPIGLQIGPDASPREAEARVKQGQHDDRRDHQHAPRRIEQLVQCFARSDARGSRRDHQREDQREEQREPDQVFDCANDMSFHVHVVSVLSFCGRSAFAGCASVARARRLSMQR